MKSPTDTPNFLGLRTAIYHAPDLAKAKSWYSRILGIEPYFDQPFYVGFNVGGYELGLDPDPSSTHMGETREERIVQFLEENDVAVLGMREGSWLRRRDHDLRLGGTTGARLFERGHEPREFVENDDLSFLLDANPGFDQPQ